MTSARAEVFFMQMYFLCLKTKTYYIEYYEWIIFGYNKLILYSIHKYVLRTTFIYGNITVVRKIINRTKL